MEKEFIENALKVMQFNIEESEKDLVQFVNMREYGVANKQKPLLLTIGLQSCIALIAYEKSFSYLAHMNVIKGNCKSDFELDENNEIVRCKKIDNLYDEILKNKDKITNTINIGLVLGVTPVEKDHESIKLIEKYLQEIFEKLRINYISAIRMPDINSYSFILDSRTGKIIHDGVENENRVTNIALNKKIENKEEKLR